MSNHGLIDVFGSLIIGDFVNQALDSGSTWRTRPLVVGSLRTFEAVARHLNFRVAAQELALTQSAVSRQIQSLEQELGSALFVRHTRSVELSQAGRMLLQAVVPSLERVDSVVKQIRQRSNRPSVAITTFASFASMWLIPRLEAFQQQNASIDLRIDASDIAVDLENSELDVALRYGPAKNMPPGAIRLFGESIAPVASPKLLKGKMSLKKPLDLTQFTLIEDGAVAQSHLVWLTWRAWYAMHKVTRLEPKRWLHFDYAYQITQAALAGQGIALARTSLVAEYLANGQLVEVLKEHRVASPMAYWLIIRTQSALRPEIIGLTQWIQAQAQKTRELIGDGPHPDTLTGSLDD